MPVPEGLLSVPSLTCDGLTDHSFLAAQLFCEQEPLSPSLTKIQLLQDVRKQKQMSEKVPSALISDITLLSQNCCKSGSSY